LSTAATGKADSTAAPVSVEEVSKKSLADATENACSDLDFLTESPGANSEQLGVPKLKDGAASVLKVPVWRQDDCEAPGWLVLALSACTVAQIFVLAELTEAARCKAELKNAWAHRLFGVPEVRQACPPRTLTVLALLVACGWAAALLLAVLPTSFRNNATKLALGIGILALSLRFSLAFSDASLDIAALNPTIMIQIVAIFLVYELGAFRRDRTAEVLEEEAQRPAREQELVKLLTAYVQPYYKDLLASSNWSSTVDLCLNGGILITFVLVIFRVRQDISVDALLPAILANVLGLNVPLVLCYGFLALFSTPFLPLLVYFFRGVDGALRRLRLGAGRSRARALQRIAVQTAKLVATREQELRDLLSVCSDDMSDEVGTGTAILDRFGTTPSIAKATDGNRTPKWAQLGENGFRRWVDTQAQRLVDYRLGEAWQVDAELISETEAEQAHAQTAGLLTAARETADLISDLGGATARAALVTLAPQRWLWRVLALCVIVCAFAAWYQAKP